MTEKKDQSFEDSLERIREIVGELEGGELSLEDSITCFREGSTLIDQARKLIADADARLADYKESNEGWL